MKKITLLLGILLLSHSMCNAEINRTIYGIPLLTSISNAKQYLGNKGIKYETQQTELGYTIFGTGNIVFANIRWSSIIISVRKGKVFNIGFVKDSDDSEIISQNYMRIVDNLKEKYNEYIQQPIRQESNAAMSFSINFDDNQTMILTSCEINAFDNSSIMITYVDKVMYQEYQQAGKDDL